MVSNLSSARPSFPQTVTLLLENLASGDISASILEFPQFRVEAASQEEAIAQLKRRFLERIEHIETLSWDIPVKESAPAWLKHAGVFQNDPDFEAISEELRTERETDDASEVDPTYYE